MAWPYSPLQSYVDNTPPGVSAADLNGMQNAINLLFTLLGPYGRGTDGAGIITAGTTTLTRDMHYTSLTVQNGATLKPNGYAIYAQSFIDAQLGCTIDWSGLNASSTTGGGAGTTLGPHGCAGASAVANIGSGCVPFSTCGLGGTASPGVGSGGAGGGGGAGAGGPGTVLTVPTSSDWKQYPFRLGAISQGLQVSNGNPTNTVGTRGASLDYLRGGAGGGAGGGDGSFLGGGGGAGGSLGILIAPTITIEATANMWSNGGTGASPVSGNTGGGGGGAGGAFLYVCRLLSDNGSYQASTGAHGFAAGTGSPGTYSNNGNATPYVVLLP